ncbi:hypothetical protein NMY22_g18952 [Coprinellus aureogranulatus]|nr:hypothetical protein NMY22_g18952 [Coprinellus aureogranulatus]
MTDRNVTINDLTGKVIERTGEVAHTVTGVPLPLCREVIVPKNLKEEDGWWQTFKNAAPFPKRIGAAVMPERIPTVIGGLSEDDLLKFFRVHDGKHYLHCGCPLEEAIFDFVIWKAAPAITSPTSNAVECLGTPFDVRSRHIFASLMSSIGFGPENLDAAFRYNRQGKLNDLTKAPLFIQNFWKEVEARVAHKEPIVEPKPDPKPARPYPGYVEPDSLQGLPSQNLFSEDEESPDMPSTSGHRTFRDLNAIARDEHAMEIEVMNQGQLPEMNGVPMEVDIVKEETREVSLASQGGGSNLIPEQGEVSVTPQGDKFEVVVKVEEEPSMPPARETKPSAPLRF